MHGRETAVPVRYFWPLDAMFKYATPGFVVASLLCVFLLQMLQSKLESRTGSRVPLVLRYFVWMYMLFFVLLFQALRSMFWEVLWVSNWLDPGYVENMVEAKMMREESTNDEFTRRFHQWQETACLTHRPWLRAFSMVSPFMVTATFVTCLIHTAVHARNMERCLDEKNEQVALYHSMVIRILALPMVYGLMSFQGVVRMWGVTVDYVDGSFQSWDHRRKYLKDMYEQALLVGDAYESYALLNFAWLAMRVLIQHVQRKIDNAEHSLPDLVANRSLKVLTKSTANLVTEMRGVTLLGVHLFCLTCASQAAFQLGTTSAAYFEVYPRFFGSYKDDERGVLRVASTASKIEYFFLGAGFISSFAAIGNLVEVEKGFHRKELLQFGPFLKFWGTKCLVTIAYLQGMLVYLPPFSHWPGNMFRLFYATTLSVECFFISLLHVFAWSPNEEWLAAGPNDGWSSAESDTFSRDSSSDAEE